MPATILTTKLYFPPPRPGMIPRPRLIKQLNKGSAGKLTLISASAGFGKTTLLSDWVARCGKPVAWLSLDEADNDPIRFLTYIVAAVQTIDANIEKGILAILQSSQPPPIEQILTILLNDITTISNGFILVLDDYHEINSKLVDEALSFLIEHQPPQMHLVIATREDPSLPLARLRARGQLTELRAADLRFTPAEAAEFLIQVMGLKLSTEDINALEARTEGWIAGLQLAALSMQGLSDATSFIQSFTGSNRFVLDYLIEEVLGRQPENIQTFLLHTSILDRLCGPLCDAVLGSPSRSTSGQETLEYLEHANLFVVPLDQERRWYRYHHLFGDLLRQRLGNPPELPEYHLRASAWYEANDDLAQAFNHSLVAGDFERAARLAEMAWQGMDRSFQSAAWLGWVKKLPEDVVHFRPVLSAQMGLAFMDAGEPEASESRLRDAERYLNGSSDEMIVVDKAQLKPLPAMIAMTRAYNAQVQGDLSATVKYAELALQLIPEGDLFRRAQATITLEVTHWARGDLESARSAMVDWMNSMQKAGNFAIVVASAFALADILVEQGHLHEAEKTYQQALQLAAEHGSEVQQITAHHHLGLALIYHETGDSESTAAHLQTAADLGQRTTLVDWTHRWNLAQARLKESAGDWDAALELLDKARQVYVKTLIPNLQPIEARKTRVYLKQGRLDKAQAWARERSISTEDEVHYLDEYEHLTLARVRLSEGSFTGVNDLLERLLALAETQMRTGSVIEILLTQALVHQAQSNHPKAIAALERALTLAEPEGYLNIFVDEGEAMRLLIENQSRNRDHPLTGYADKLLASFTQSVAAPKSVIRHQRADVIEPLSEREMEVLKLLRSELSGPEIARQLIVSLNTLHTHTSNIYNKLGVNNRRAAVRRAEELDLL